MPFSSATLRLLHAEKNKVLFTYSVEWMKSDVAWASRWDTYLRMSDVEVSLLSYNIRHFRGVGRLVYTVLHWSKMVEY